MPVRNLYDSVRCIALLELYSTAAPIQMVNNRYKVTRYSLLYTNGVMCTALIGLIVGIVGKFQYSNYDTELGSFGPLALFVACLEILISIITCVVSNGSLQINKYKHIELIDSIQRLDATLIKELQVKMNYEKISRKNFILVTSFTIFFISILFTLVANIIEDDLIFTPLIGVSYGLVFIPPAATSYVAMNFADLVRIRFRLMQKLLNPDYLKQRFKRGAVRIKKLEFLVHKYQDLFAIVKQISEVYGIPLLMIHFHDFTMTTSQMFFIYWKSMDGESHVKLFVLFALWMFPIFWKTVFLPLYMHLVIKESELCIQLVMRHDHDSPETNAREIIHSFLLWNRHNKTKISVVGLFNSDLSTGLMICSAVAMYLLVLIQFQMQEEELKKEF